MEEYGFLQPWTRANALKSLSAPPGAGLGCLGIELLQAICLPSEPCMLHMTKDGIPEFCTLPESPQLEPDNTGLFPEVLGEEGLTALRMGAGRVSEGGGSGFRRLLE